MIIFNNWNIWPKILFFVYLSCEEYRIFENRFDLITFDSIGSQRWLNTIIELETIVRVLVIFTSNSRWERLIKKWGKEREKVRQDKKTQIMGCLFASNNCTAEKGVLVTCRKVEREIVKNDVLKKNERTVA